MDWADDCVDVLLMIEDPPLRDSGLGWCLQQLLGFTEAAADLTVRLLDGLTPDQAEEARGGKRSTVRSQIKRLVMNTAPSRLSELTAPLARVPGGWPPAA